MLGILAGAAVGATIGILFAPDKGSSTRKKISKKGQDLAEELGEKFNDIIENVTHKFESMKEEASRMIRKGKDADVEVDSAAN